ncbi:unnamed protein product [Staurois parvus]|uniref:Uncharacterized protein n=1 Tax=Staurois parvus TaxID=386267 RepID=A0ABN9DZV5_9NEOB|nr:unnamed protein product [Staurois parvus]
MGTGGWHWWAQVSWHRWVALLGTGRWHFWAQEGATGGCIAGHRWAHCWAQVGGTCVWHCWAPIIRALMISDPDDWCRSLL